MTTDQMRCRLATLYPGPKWKLKCQTMPDRQVVAIFKSLNERDFFRTQKLKKKNEPGVMEAVQLTIFDLPGMEDYRLEPIYRSL